MTASPSFKILSDRVRVALDLAMAEGPWPPWDEEMWKLARTHKVATILAPQILKEGGAMTEEVRKYWDLAILRESYYLQQSREILAELEQRGLAAVALKGVALAEKAYPQKGQRSFRDLDLLVSKAELKAIDEILVKKGFRRFQTEGPLSRAATNRGDSLGAAQDEIDAVAYQRDDLFVELHTSIVPPILGHYPLDHVWTTGFSAEDFLVHLFFHTTRHHFLFGLRHLADVAVWVQTQKPNFQDVLNKLDHAGLRNLAFPAWSIAHRFSPEAVPPPPPCSSRLIGSYTRAVANQIEEMPNRAIGLAGSPFPLIWFRSSPLTTLGRLWRGVPGQKRYQVGDGASSWEKISWGITRPWKLCWRHAPILRQWAKFFLR